MTNKPSVPEKLSEAQEVTHNNALLPGKMPIASVPLGEWVIFFEDEAIYKGRVFSWSETDPDDRSYEAACGQPVCYTPEPTHWAPIPEGWNDK